MLQDSYDIDSDSDDEVDIGSNKEAFPLVQDIQTVTRI
jgi:hypothetical protein